MALIETSRTSAYSRDPRIVRSTAPSTLGSLQAVGFFPAGAEIYAQGERSDSHYKIEFGAVRVYRLLADGRRQISAFHFAGEVFGFEADAIHHFFAEAICATNIRVLRTSSRQNELSGELLSMALQSLVRAQEHLLVLGRQNAMERVAAFLTEMSERQDDLGNIELPMSRMDIADYLGLTIETVSRVFSRLRQQGVIRLTGLRTVEVMKWQALQHMID
ncbi:cyclic nucleotide-binding domain-containing protein [Pseudaminobacter arsenicus]|uniref:Cyclic nucleotide-binding domain-containing protein n=1 Tax=Borborobacter arsenicus TaxID=1851146 RepID=A0A432V1E1_9HYPH|nr:helix-turn-helix domain-containing protein [Pseudaminobacter arsenicus]RUM95971.1 cyclic nucleotide-binding domain-containing protein [Pseudaminobacter arsenicus]